MKALKQWYANLSIRIKLSLSYAVLIILPTLALTIFANIITGSIIISKDTNNSINDLDAYSKSLYDLMENADNILKITVSNPSVERFVLSYHTDQLTKMENIAVTGVILDSMIQPKASISSISIYGYNGFVGGSGLVNQSALMPVSKTTDPYYDHMLVSWGKPIIINTHPITTEAESNGRYNDAVTFERPIINFDTGDIIGRAELNVGTSAISGLFPNTLYQGAEYFIADSHGVLVASSKSGNLYKNISGAEYFSYISTGDHGGRTFDLDGQKYLITYKKYAPLDWTIVSIIPVKYALMDYKRVTLTIFAVSFICMLLAVLMSYFISQSISKPIIELSTLMNNAGQGDLEVRAAVHGHDETGQLSDHFNRMIEQISTLMDKFYKEQKKKREIEFTALQAQINPHFLYNTLESVCSLAIMNKNQEVYSMVKSLAMFYRSVLSKGKNVITIAEEIENVKNYLAIQKIRYNDKFNYELKIDDAILDFPILKLTVQPLVENSIYHGIKQKRAMGLIRITGGLDGDRIRLSVFDNGVGMAQEEIDKVLLSGNQSNSFGLKSVDERIKLYFGANYGISIRSAAGEWTKIDIFLPAERLSL